MSSVYVTGETATLIEHTKGLLNGPSGSESPIAPGRLRSVPRWLPDGNEVTTVEQAAVLMGVDVKVAAHTVLQSDVSDDLQTDARIFLSNKSEITRHQPGKRQPNTSGKRPPVGGGKFQEELHPRGTGAQGGQFVKKGTSSQPGKKQPPNMSQGGALRQGPKAHPIYEVASHGDRKTGDGASIKVGGHTYKLKVDGNKITVTGEKGHELILHGGEGIDPIKLAAYRVHQYQTQFRNESGTYKTEAEIRASKRAYRRDYTTGGERSEAIAKATAAVRAKAAAKAAAAKKKQPKDTGDNTLPKKKAAAAAKKSTAPDKKWGDLTADQQHDYLVALAQGKSPEEAGRPFGFVSQAAEAAKKPAKKASKKVFGEDLEVKVVRHVRDESYWGQPKGSIIVAKVRMPNLKSIKNEWDGGEAVQHTKSKKKFLIVEHPEEKGEFYALDYNKPDWTKPAAQGKQEDVYRKIDGSGATEQIKQPAKKTTPAKKAAAPKVTTSVDIEPGARVTIGNAKSGSLVYEVEKINGANAIIKDSNGTKRTIKAERLSRIGGGQVTHIKGSKPPGFDELSLKEKHKVAHLMNMPNGFPGELAMQMVQDARNPKVSEALDNYSDQQLLDGIRSMRKQIADMKRLKKPAPQRMQDMLQDYLNEARSRGI